MNFNLFLLSIYLGLIFFEPQQFFPFLENLRFTFSFGILVIFYSIINSPSDVKSNLVKSKIFWLTFILVIICFFSVFFNPSLNVNNFIESDLLKSFILFLIVVLLIKNESDFILLCWILIIYTAIDAIVTIYFYHLGVLPTRLSSYFGGLGTSGSNEYATLMVMMLPFPIILQLTKRPKFQKIFLITCTFAFLYCLTRTHSRAGFIGLMVISLAFMYYKYFSYKQIIIATLFISLLFVKSPASYFTRMESISDKNTYEEDSNVTSRFDTYKEAIILIKENTCLGVGLGNYQEYSRIRFSYPPYKGIYVPHNSPLTVGAESGIISLSLFILIILFTFLQFKKLSRLENINDELITDFFIFLKAANISVLGYAILAMTLSIPYQRIFYILIALAISSKKIISDKSNYL